MGTVILIIFMSGAHSNAVEFSSMAKCQAAKAAIAQAYSNYIGPRTVCVPK